MSDFNTWSLWTQCSNNTSEFKIVEGRLPALYICLRRDGGINILNLLSNFILSTTSYWSHQPFSSRQYQINAFLMSLKRINENSRESRDFKFNSNISSSCSRVVCFSLILLLTQRAHTTMSGSEEYESSAAAVEVVRK